MKWKATGIGLIAVLFSLGCSTSNQLSTGTIYDAKAQIDAAKEVGAENLATQELIDAEQMLARAEAALQDGKKDAHRLSVHAYLKARVAEELAIATQMEAQAQELEQQLELKAQAAEAVRREFVDAERELEQLKLTPEK